MKSTYSIQTDQLTPAGEDNGTVFIYSQPSEEERNQLLQQFHLDRLELEAINDPDEVPRLENIPDGLLIIWKRPDNVSRGETVEFEVSSLGLVLGKDKAAVVVPRGEIPLTAREFKKVASTTDFLFRVLLHSIHHYQSHLKAIKMISADLQTKIVASMENKYLLQMFTLGESLVYYHNALEANGAILAKLRALSDRLKLTTEQVHFLDDAVIENQQAAKQAAIYEAVLSGLMDARGTIINNNMNVLLKNLTIINVVFLPLNLIASILGMSEFSMLTQGMNWWVSYGLFSLAMVLLGWLTWWWLVKVIERKQSGMGRKKR
jgi:magnesium transporter